MGSKMFFDNLSSAERHRFLCDKQDPLMRGTATHQWIMFTEPRRSTLTWQKLY